MVNSSKIDILKMQIQDKAIPSINPPIFAQTFKIIAIHLSNP